MMSAVECSAGVAGPIFNLPGLNERRLVITQAGLYSARKLWCGTKKLFCFYVWGEEEQVKIKKINKLNSFKYQKNEEKLQLTGEQGISQPVRIVAPIPK